MSPPRSSIAHWKTATALTIVASAVLGPVSVEQAHAFKIFGMRFFESAEEEVQVIDPVRYTLTFEPGTDDEELREALENGSQLVQDQEEPVSGDLGLAIKARDDRDRLLAVLYEKARYGGTVSILVNGQDIDSLPPDPAFPDGQPVPVVVRVAPGPAFTLGTVRLEGDAARLDPAAYDLKRGARADSTLIIKAGEQIVNDLKEQSRPLAKLAERSVVADHATSTVDVTIRADGGPVAPVGNLTVSGARTVDPDFVKDYSRLNHGRPYSPENIRKAAERLRQLNVFSSVTINEADGLAPDGTIPMNIQVSEGKHRYFGSADRSRPRTALASRAIGAIAISSDVPNRFGSKARSIASARPPMSPASIIRPAFSSRNPAPSDRPRPLPQASRRRSSIRMPIVPKRLPPRPAPPSSFRPKTRSPSARKWAGRMSTTLSARIPISPPPSRSNMSATHAMTS